MDSILGDINVADPTAGEDSDQEMADLAPRSVGKQEKKKKDKKEKKEKTKHADDDVDEHKKEKKKRKH
jgi:nucleolar protein 56